MPDDYGSKLWNLDVTIAEFALPLIKQFKERVMSYPSDVGSEDAWVKILDKIVRAMELLIDDMSECRNERETDYRSMQEGFELFGKYYMHLWD